MVMLIVTNPYVMSQVLGTLVLVVLPSLYCRPPRAQAQPRQPGPGGRRAPSPPRCSTPSPWCRATRRRRARPSASTRHRERLRDRAQAHQGALLPGRLHHHRHLRCAAVGPVPGHAGGDRRADQRRPPGADGGVRDHPGRQRGGAVRGLRRPAARRRRHRAADGAAGHELVVASPARPRALPPHAGGSSVACAAVTFHYPSRPKQRHWPTSPATCAPARRWPWSAPAARARARCSSCCCASTTQAGTIELDGVPHREAALAACAAHRHRAAGQRDLLGQRWRTSATAGPMPATRR
jgi:ATP-binding cassette subfamily B protein